VQRFDLKAQAFEGEPLEIAEGVASFSASDSGLIVYRKVTAVQSGQIINQLVWFDRNGRQSGRVDGSANYESVELSPKGGRVAVAASENGNRDILNIDLNRGVRDRLTSNPSADHTPVWASDETQIIFCTGRDAQSGAPSLYTRSSSSVGDDKLLFNGRPGASVPTDWSSDRRYVIFIRRLATAGVPWDLWYLPMFGDNRKEMPYMQSQHRKAQAKFSPDGRFLAYTTNESGRYQIVVQTFPDPNVGKWTVTKDGGFEPRWRRDGRELFYLAPDGKLMAVQIKNGPTFDFGQTVELFQTPITVSAELPAFGSDYDVTADGQRFLLIAPVTAPGGSPQAPTESITAILNWTAARARPQVR
jgi:eukaryotic-like serine/threonine-protein kinase